MQRDPELQRAGGPDAPYSSRIPPPGPMSPDGRRVWPRPSLTARIVVWGGVAAATAAATAGAVILGRAAANALSADDPAPRRVDPRTPRDPATLAPRFAELDEDAREAVRRRARERARAQMQRDRAARVRAAERRNIVGDITESAAELSGSLNSVAAAVDRAFGSFRSVAAQSSAIIAEFGAAADLIRETARPRAASDQDEQK